MVLNAYGRNFADKRRQCWQTPPELFNDLNSIFSFTVDAAASDSNTLLPRYWTEETDARTQDWSGETVYCNPPYKIPGEFMAKAPEATTAVFLVPTNCLTTKYYHANPGSLHCYPGYRVQFVSDELGKSNPALGSVIVIYGKVKPKQIAELQDIGNVFVNVEHI